ncbi:hypothetical protein ACQ4PT_035203 [Festuca glaucescens]
MTARYKIVPDVKHYGCMIDMLCRYGKVSEAYQMINDVPIKVNSVLWKMVLAACRVQGHMDVADKVFHKLQELMPVNDGDVITISNVYAESNRWDDVEHLRTKAEARRRLRRKILLAVAVAVVVPLYLHLLFSLLNLVDPFLSSSAVTPKSRLLQSNPSSSSLRIEPRWSAFLATPDFRNGRGRPGGAARDPSCIDALGRGFDANHDTRLLYCKGSRLVEVDEGELSSRDLVVSDGLTVLGVPKDVDCSAESGTGGQETAGPCGFYEVPMTDNKPPIEELRYFLEFQLPRVGASS